MKSDQFPTEKIYINRQEEKPDRQTLNLMWYIVNVTYSVLFL